MYPVIQNHWPSQVQQGDVTVQIFLPVVLRVHNDFINGHDLLNALFKPRKFKRIEGLFYTRGGQSTPQDQINLF